MKKIFSYIFILFAIIIWSNCANVRNQGPAGGPKDTVGPVVLREIPKNDQKNVSTKKVEVFFDEYVKIKDPKQFIVSPPLKSQPTFITRGKKVVVETDSALNAGTTYIFDFGASIVDLNEGNPLGDYRLRFSTGDVIDTMRFTGRALDAFTYDSVKDMKVLMYEKDIDSLPFTTPPDAVARVSNRGFFIVEGLKNKPYKVIAIEDKNNNNLYDADEKVGFLSGMVKPVTFQSDTMKISDYEKDSISTFDNLPLIRIFKENIKSQYLVEYKRSEERKAVLVFARENPIIDSLSFFGKDSTIIDKSKIIAEPSFLGDTINYWFTNDSVPEQMSAQIVYQKPDSTGVYVPTKTVLKFKSIKKTEKKSHKAEENAKEEKPKLAISTLLNEKLVMEKGFDIIFKAPLIILDTTKISFYKFDEEGKSLGKIPFSITKDSANLCRYVFQTPKWETGLTYEAKFLDSAFVDIYRLANDSVRQKIQTPNPDKFSTLALSFTNVKCNIIVQLIKGKSVVQTKYISKDGKLVFQFIDPDIYSIRLIEDLNGNSRWDTGSLKKHLQPERVTDYKLSDGKRTIKLRQGWENELDVDINNFFK